MRAFRKPQLFQCRGTTKTGSRCGVMLHKAEVEYSGGYCGLHKHQRGQEPPQEPPEPEGPSWLDTMREKYDPGPLCLKCGQPVGRNAAGCRRDPCPHCAHPYPDGDCSDA